MSVAPLALGYDIRSPQANVQRVEIPRRGSYIMVTPGNSNAPGATGAALAQQEIHWSAEFASTMGILSVLPVLAGEQTPMQLQWTSRINIDLTGRSQLSTFMYSYRAYGGGRGHDTSVLLLNVDILLMLPPGGYD